VSTCDPQSSLNFYIGLTSIQSNPTYANVSEIVVPVSYGTGYYIVAPDTIQVVVPQNATTINYQGCQSAISLPVPTGATQAQINAIVQQVMQQAAQQLSQCNAPAPTNPFDAALAPTLYSNAVKSSGCSGFPGIKVTGNLPAGITASPSSITVAAGIFTSSVSQADADSQASLFLIYFIEANCQCGWWNTLQICPGGGQVAANTYFSTVSQDDANAQALAGGCGSPLLIGLSAYYDLDENAGSDRVDKLGGPSLVEVSNTSGPSPSQVPAIPGIIGQGVSIDPTYNRATGMLWTGTTTHPAYITGDWSISVWMNAENGFLGVGIGYPIGSYRWQWMLDCQNWDPTGYYGHGAGYPGFTVWDSSGVPYTAAMSFDDGFAWNHFVCTYNSASGTINTYQNGSLISTQSGVPSIDQFACQFTLGRDAGVDDCCISSAYINYDEIGIWGRVLSPSEITQLYNGGNGLAYPF